MYGEGGFNGSTRSSTCACTSLIAQLCDAQKEESCCISKGIREDVGLIKSLAALMCTY